MSETVIVATGGTDYLNADPRIRSWLTTTDHKRIGVMFLVATTLALALGGVFAMIIRLELLTPPQDLTTAETYNRLFTMHGVIMVWAFLIPSIPNSFGNFLVPLMLGARDLAFPRLNLASLYVYLAGALWVVAALFIGGADTGWTFYPPYSSSSPTAVTWVAAGVFVLGISSTMTGINFVVTTHTLRAEGMTWNRIPLFVWTIYATSIVLVCATPVLGMALLLVAIDHAFRWGLFDPQLGGDPILYQHLFWFYSHPAVYIMILPAMGVMSEVVETFSRKFTLSYEWMVGATVGIAIVGFLVWGHHMFVSGMSTVDTIAFSFFSMAVAVFSAIKVFLWVGTLYRGSIAFTTPLAYFVAFVFLFGWGGLSGVAVATSSLDVPWHATYFIVGHFHFVMVGAAMMGFLSALHYWWPKMFGRMYSERFALVTASAVFIGFVVTFTPQFLLGNMGMPRRYGQYPPAYQVLNVISTAGSWALASGLLATVAYLGWSLFKGPAAGPNPWGSRGFEWMSDSPPPTHNFPAPPRITRRPH
ncbi:MAG: cbb3-type cytochrome c oxidase subunit I, partial [Vicinamibacterales bacterium]